MEIINITEQEFLDAENNKIYYLMDYKDISIQMVSNYFFPGDIQLIANHQHKTEEKNPRYFICLSINILKEQTNQEFEVVKIKEYFEILKLNQFDFFSLFFSKKIKTFFDKNKYYNKEIIEKEIQNLIIKNKDNFIY